jgi:hypothetical protein
MTDMPNFENHVMLCNSTGNQAINLIPAVQFKCKQTLIISTSFAQNQGFTDRLIKVFNDYGIASEIEGIGDLEEKNLSVLTSRLEKITKKYPQILWNISGGQKIPSAAMLIAFQQRTSSGFDEDCVAYTEATPPEIWYFGRDYKSKKEKTSVFISLKEILYLSGYEPMGDEDRLYPDPSDKVKDEIDIGRKAFAYFKDDEFFREAFFNHMKPSKSNVNTRAEIEDLLKEALNAVKPKLSDIRVAYVKGYENLEREINNIFSNLDKVKNKKELEQLIKPLKIIQKPSVLYEDYWNGIKKLAITDVLKKIEFNEVKLIKSDINKIPIQQLIEQIKNIGGEIQQDDSVPLCKRHILHFSKFRSNGFLFEWMVAAAILEGIEKSEVIKNSVSEVYHSVKTKNLNSDKQDAEHDIVIVTKFGTLIIIELKTYEFSGDLAQAQEGLAYKKSGPYGKAMIVGPLFSYMVKRKENGQKDIPDYIEGPIKAQQETAMQNGIEYYYLDQLPDMLRKKLSA